MYSRGVNSSKAETQKAAGVFVPGIPRPSMLRKHSAHHPAHQNWETRLRQVIFSSHHINTSLTIPLTDSLVRMMRLYLKPPVPFGICVVQWPLLRWPLSITINFQTQAWVPISGQHPLFLGLVRRSTVLGLLS